VFIPVGSLGSVLGDPVFPYNRNIFTFCQVIFLAIKSSMLQFPKMGIFLIPKMGILYNLVRD